MDFYTIVLIVMIVLLIICLTLFGVYYNSIKTKPFPETQAICPKNWTNTDGNCMNPAAGSLNRLTTIPTTTPGYSSRVNGINPNDEKWSSYLGAKNSICGKKKWADSNGISWDGVSNYNSC